MRLKAVVEKLKRFHPSKNWEVYKVDMKEVNEELMNVDRGRMVLHRIIMFRAAERIAESEGLKAIVTGESMGQKSSQTLSNLSVTTRTLEKPIIRPLITWNKNDIVDVAKQIGTFEEAEIASACSKMSPNNPATSMKPDDLEELKGNVDMDELVDAAVDSSKKVRF
jgi:thiamine biosynthesis protein ThiI